MRIGRWIGRMALVAGSIALPGCAHGPRRFEKIENPAPMVRARAVGLGTRHPDAQVLPALIGRLADSDPVVRMAAHEELRKRTGNDFGYVPWGSPEERSAAIARWRAWLAGASATSGGPLPSRQSSSPAVSPRKTARTDASPRLSP